MAINVSPAARELTVSDRDLDAKIVHRKRIAREKVKFFARGGVVRRFAIGGEEIGSYRVGAFGKMMWQNVAPMPLPN